RGLPQVLRVLARGRARGVDVVLHRRSVRARRRRRPRRVGVGIRRLRSDPSETADDGHRRRVRPGGKPGDDLVPGAIDAACVGPELGEPILADLHLLWAVSWFVYASHRVDADHARSFRLFLTGAAVAVALRTALVFFGTVNAANTTFSFLEGLRLGTILVIFGTFNAVTDPFGLVRMAPRHFHEPALA